MSKLILLGIELLQHCFQCRRALDTCPHRNLIISPNINNQPNSPRTASDTRKPLRSESGSYRLDSASITTRLPQNNGATMAQTGWCPKPPHAPQTSQDNRH